MGLQPNIPLVEYSEQTCTRCGRKLNANQFCPTKAIARNPSNKSDICNECLQGILEESSYSWDTVNLLCQYLNIPFIPEKFEELKSLDKTTAFPQYAAIFQQVPYTQLNWKAYWEEFRKLEDANLIDRELPRLKDDRLAHLREKWGANYSDEQLLYLESLYAGMLTSQNINGALQVDQAKKLCKTSLEIDERIRAGQEYDKILTSYEKLVKIAEFTPKNAKNATDFDSVGELFHWLEKRGWKNTFYDGVTKDVVDETLKNIQNYNQRLYVNESGIGEEITRRSEALQHAAELESIYDTAQDIRLDEYDNDGYEELFNEEFKEEL